MPRDYDVYGNETYGQVRPVPGGTRTRGAFAGPTGARASGGFGVPITAPMGGRSRSPQDFSNEQDVATPAGGPQSVSNLVTPQDITAGLNGTPPATPTPRFAPTGAQVQDNPGQWAGTSFDPNRSIGYTYDPGGANSMPQGSEVVDGVAQYTGANAPLDRTKFTPVNNQANVWYKENFDSANPNSVSYLQFADELGRNALGAAGGNWTNGDSIATQQAYLDSAAGKQWVNRLRTPWGTPIR